MAKNFLGKELLICRYHSNKHKCQGMEQTSMLKILQEKVELFKTQEQFRFQQSLLKYNLANCFTYHNTNTSSTVCIIEPTA